MEALLNTHFHLDAVVNFGRLAEVLHDKLLLLRNVGCILPRHGNTQKVPQTHVEAIVALVGLIDALERKGVRLLLRQLAGPSRAPERGDVNS